MYPKKGDKHKLQKIFLAFTPFNILFLEYFKKRGNFILEKYIDQLVDQYVRESKITPEELIQQIEEEYKKYVDSLPKQDGTN
jgi:hypothetical protein